MLKSKKTYKLASIGKKLLVALGIAVTTLGAVFSLASCGPKTPTIDPPTPPPTVEVDPYSNVGDLVEEKGNAVYNLINAKTAEVFSEATGKTYNKDNIIFSAVDVNEADEKLTSVNYTFGYKTGETTRSFVSANATFNEVALKDIADGKTSGFTLTNVTVGSSVNYDAQEKQNDADFFESLYGGAHDKVNVAYTAEHFNQVDPVKSYSSVGELVEENETAVYNLLGEKSADVFSAATGKAYNKDNLVFASIDVDEEDEGLTNANYVFGYKTGETTRTYVSVNATFSDVALEDIANGNTNDFELTNITVGTAINYDAQEKQNDADFFETLYGGEHDNIAVSYTAEEFGNNQQTDVTTLSELLANHAETVYDNILASNHYENVVKKVFGRYYGTDRYTILDTDIDLGETTDNKIDDISMKVTYKNTSGDSYTVACYTVDFASAVELNDLMSTEELNKVNSTVTQDYSFNYVSAEQGTRDALVQAIANVAVTDGFEYDANDILFKQLTDSTDATLGTVKRYTVVINNENGIREINISIANASSDQALINNINNGRYNVNYSESANFSGNYINIVSEMENE